MVIPFSLSVTSHLYGYMFDCAIVFTTWLADLSMRNVDYSILLVMSELSTMRCDRALGLWIAGTRASSVDGELPWRSSGRAAAVASTPGRKWRRKAGFLVCATKPRRRTAVEDAKSWRHGRRSRD